MKKWARVLCLLFICAFVGVMCTACLPLQDNNSDFDNYDPDDPESTPGFYPDKMDLYGTKVLYHPTNYEFDTDNGELNADYFGEYAYDIMEALAVTYGYTTYDEMQKYVPIGFNTDYFYDSIRYNLYQQNEYLEKYSVSPYNGTPNQQEQAGGNFVEYNGKWYKYDDANTDFEKFASISIDFEKSWLWSFNPESQPQGYIFDENISDLWKDNQSNSIITQDYYITENGIEYFIDIDGYYERNSSAYRQAYLGTEDAKDNQNYNDYIKALEYVIYCISMNATPKKITPRSDYTLTIEGYSSVDAALEYAKAAFNKVGLYVGVSKDGQQELTQYILNNIIGQNAINADAAGVAVHKYAIYEYTDDSGATQQFYKEIEPATNLKVGRNYQYAVEKIVDLVCNEVKIGSDDEDTVDNKYLASYIKDYFGNQFSWCADDGNEFNGIEAQEYQSLIIMPKNQIKIDNLSVFFMYDGNMDDITIKVHINVFKNGKYYENVAEDQTTVPKGEFGIWDEHEIDFFGLDGVDDDGNTDREGWKIGEFNVDVGEGLLRPTKNGSKFQYNGTMSISDELRIVGTSKVKRLYKVVETGNGQYYGKMDHEQFAKLSGACDYMEIAYEIVKEPIDINDYSSPDELPDYRFYTAVSVMNS